MNSASDLSTWQAVHVQAGQHRRQPIGADAAVIAEHALARSKTLELNFAGDPAALTAGGPSRALAAVCGIANIVVTGLDFVGKPTELNRRDIEVEAVQTPEDADLLLVEAERRIRCTEAKGEDEDAEQEQQRLAAICALSSD